MVWEFSQILSLSLGDASPKWGDHLVDGTHLHPPIRLVGLIKLTTTTFRHHTFRHHLYYIVHNKEVGMPQ